jgi:hypothetical protein
MPRYFRVVPRVWTDHPTWSNDAQLLALYLLTCPHRTTEGLYRLPMAYVRADLNWSQQPLRKGLRERLAEAFAELSASGFCEYDEQAQVVLVMGALETQAPENPNQVTAAIKQLEELPPTHLTSTFKRLAERFCGRLAERLPEGFGEPFGKPPSPSPPPSSTSNYNDASGVAADQAAGRTPIGAGSPNRSAVRPRAAPATTGAGASDDHRDDVERLCGHLADRIEANGSKRPAITDQWRDAARLLIDRDGRTEAQIHTAIDWCQTDDFWRANVLSMPKLRDKYDQLRLQARRSNGTAPKPSTTDQRVQAALDLAAEVRAERLAAEATPPPQLHALPGGAA